MKRHVLSSTRASLVLAAALLAALFPAVPAGAQETARQEAVAEASSVQPRVLTIDDYARWRSIDGAAISADGGWVGWTYTRRRADSELHLRRLADGREHVVERGSQPQISDDGRFAAYLVSLPWDEIDKLEKEGDPVPVQAQLMNLETGATWTWDDVASFAFARGGHALAVQRKKADPKAEHEGADLILRYLDSGDSGDSGTEELLGSVAEHAFNKAGTHLAYTVDAPDDNGNGVFLIDLATGVHRALDNAQETYARLTWDEDGTALAVLRGDKPEGFDERANVLLAFPDVTAPSPREVVYDPATDDSFPAGFVLSERGQLGWNDGATMVFAGLHEQLPEPEKTDEPIADVNIFHWADERIQTEQKASADRDRNFTYLSVVHVDGVSPRFVRIDTQDIPGQRRVQVTDDGRWAIVYDYRPYVSDWKPPYADIDRVDTSTGDSTRMLDKQLRTYGLSPDGAHFLFWKDAQMWDWRLDTGDSVNLTSSASVSFVDREWDYFGERPAYGVAGFTADGDAVILENRYDLWLQPLDGSPATNLTGGAGARDEVIFRYQRLDPDEKAVDLGAPVMLTAFGQWTKKAGLFELPAGGGEPTPLIWADKRIGRPLKAREADRFFYTIQDFTQFPDYWTAEYRLGSASGGGGAGGAVTYGDDDGDDPSTSALARPFKVTDADPWQDEYRWGHRILFDYTNDDGVRLQGTLAIPDDYQPGQKLPMIVRFYEKYSQDLHAYPPIRYRHEPNFAGYVSAGYLVMQPDVHFRVGSSHSDMLECVEAATRKVIEMGYADPGAIGLSGHSYSGGGSSYIAARSKMFAAVASGAAPIDLAAEFNQLFLGGGQNNHQYDIYGQGRYGTDPYDGPEVYEYESPITWVRDMNTPLLYLQGEDDPIVGYVQGMEWYNALRFNGKPIIFLSYPGEGHGLREFENQIDFQRRLRQFFEHYLRGAPAPKWMTEGRTYLEKERELRRRQ